MNICVSYEGHTKHKSNVIPMTEKKIFCKTAICKINNLELFEVMFHIVIISAHAWYALLQLLSWLPTGDCHRKSSHNTKDTICFKSKP
jgi:hypothetical protein